MEAVAAASSIAGIVGIVGQALSGIVKLRGFFQDYASASKTIDRFLRDLNSLIQTLEDVKEIVLKLEKTVAVTFDTKTILSSLQIQLEDCAKDVFEWVKIAGEQHPEFGSGGGLQGSKARFKRFLVAVNKESLTDIFRDISSYKENITLKLSVIGRSLDIEQAACLTSMTSKLDNVAEATNASSQITSDALKKLEAQLAARRDDLLDSPDLRSLASSMVSSISRIETLLLAQSPEAGSIASSAGHSSAGNRQLYGPKLSTRSIGRHSSAGSQYGGSNASSGRNRRYSGAGLPSSVPVLSRSKDESDMRYSSSPSKVAFGEYSLEDDPRGAKVLHSILGELHHVRCVHETEEVEKYPLFESYSKLLDRANEIVPDCLLRYINLVQFSRTISLHAKLLVSTQDLIQGLQRSYQDEGSSSKSTEERKIVPSSEQDGKSRLEYHDVCHQMEILEQNIAIVRKECWDEGYNLSEMDMILGTENHTQNLMTDKSTSITDEHFKALRQRLLHLQSQTIWTSKEDRINAWLLQNLAASSEAAALHRTFLPHGGKDLDEKAWARQVLKFWPLDSAAANVKWRDGKERDSSSIGGVKDGRVAHSVKVLLELVDWANSVTTGSEAGDRSSNVLRGLFEVERPRSPLGSVR